MAKSVNHRLRRFGKKTNYRIQKHKKPNRVAIHGLFQNKHLKKNLFEYFSTYNLIKILPTIQELRLKKKNHIYLIQILKFRV